MQQEATRIQIPGAMSGTEVGPENEVRPRVLTISSGWPGVGKSCLSLYLARALAQQGARVGVLDVAGRLNRSRTLMRARPGTASQPSTMAGAYGVEQVSTWSQGVDILSGVELPRGQPGRPDGEQRYGSNQIGESGGDYDYWVVDTSAGFLSLPFQDDVSNQAILLLLTPDAPVLTKTFAQLTAMRRQGISAPVQVVVNRVTDSRQAWRVFQRFNMAAEQHLGCSCQWLASIPEGGMLDLPILLRANSRLMMEKKSFSTEIFGKMVAMLDQHFQESHSLQAVDMPRDVAVATAGGEMGPVASCSATPYSTTPWRERVSSDSSDLSDPSGPAEESASLVEEDAMHRWSRAQKELLNLVASGDMGADQITRLLEELLNAAGDTWEKAAADVACQLLSRCRPESLTPNQHQALMLEMFRLTGYHQEDTEPSLRARADDSASWTDGHASTDLEAASKPADSGARPERAFDEAAFGRQEELLQQLRQADPQASLFTLLTAMRQSLEEHDEAWTTPPS